LGLKKQILGENPMLCFFFFLFFKEQEKGHLEEFPLSR
jgi:hypothetical protein